MKNEKQIYTAPEAEIETIALEDIVLISVVKGKLNLDSEENVYKWADHENW